MFYLELLKRSAVIVFYRRYFFGVVPDRTVVCMLLFFQSNFRNHKQIYIVDNPKMARYLFFILSLNAITIGKRICNNFPQIIQQLCGRLRPIFYFLNNFYIPNTMEIILNSCLQILFHIPKICFPYSL